jgi:hypothetical protein
MKKVIATFSLILCAFMFLNLNAQQLVNGPDIEFDDTVYDYGTIKQHGNGEGFFKFKNTGNAPLIIESAKGSCGCTVPSYPKAPIKPGETAEITVKYDTKRVGPINKSVTLKTNADEKPVILRIKGHVEADAMEKTPENKSLAPVEN